MSARTLALADRTPSQPGPASRLATLAVGTALQLLRRLPRGARERFASFVGWAVWVLRVRRRVALENVQLAFPELTPVEHRRIVRGAFASMSQAMLESVTSDLLTDAEVERAVSVADWKGLDVLLATHQPVLIASAHLGSWELFAEVMARRGHVFSAVVRPLTGAFNEWLVRSRERAGVELVLQRGALRNMLKAMRRGRAVVQLIDQALPGPEALWVPFFGRPASTTPAISMAALRSGAPVYVVVAVRHEGRLQMRVEGPVPMPDKPTRRESLEAHTAALTAVIETFVRQHPEQWLWLHRRWKSAPSPLGRGSG
ncbi:MAG: lysophospholipid acyltransferase family protein [Archangium sp.]|nr:lysophospholipid acyltransferase family protein [Archangium sp.]